ncbi:MAG: HEAT repeat domain-containing protein [Opitutales bacterium]
MTRFLTSLTLFGVLPFAGVSASGDSTSTSDLVHRLAERVEQGAYAPSELREVAERGGLAVRVAADLLDESKPDRSSVLCQLIGRAARNRNAPEELLKLYDPAAYETFYTEKGMATERKIGAVLDWKEWPPLFQSVAIRACPRFTRAWILQRISDSNEQSVSRTAVLIEEWSRWISFGNERQYRGAFLAMLISMSKGEAMKGSVRLSTSVLAGIEHAHGFSPCCGSSGWLKRRTRKVPEELRGKSAETCPLLGIVRTALSDDSPLIRAQACRAITSFSGTFPSEALELLLKLLELEKDDVVRARIGSSLASFPLDQRAGKAALELFRLSENSIVRREILYALAKTKWQTRDVILKEAFRFPEDGVAGVAMSAVTKEVGPGIRDRLVAISSRFKDTSPDLVDALGRLGDPRSLPYLSRCLRDEKRGVLRAKVAIALEKIDGEEADKLIEEHFIRESNRDVRLQLIRVASRRRMEDVVPTLIDLAKDQDAADDFRAEAIWGLGNFPGNRVESLLMTLSKSRGLSALYANLALTKLGNPYASTALEQLFLSGTPTERMIILALLGEARKDHPLVEQGLNSSEFAVLLGAAKAARQLGSEKYRKSLAKVSVDPHVRALLETGMRDVATLAYYLREERL